LVHKDRKVYPVRTDHRDHKVFRVYKDCRDYKVASDQRETLVIKALLVLMVLPEAMAHKAYRVSKD
jgi:mRNA-degrading endonuclease YafQ of YafQ-DinJ toxin-antitoxin module